MADNETNQDGSTTQQPSGETTQQQNGIEQRFAELTAQMHQKDATIDKLTGLVQQTLAKQLESPQNTPSPVDEFTSMMPKDASDETKQMFTQMFGQFAKLVDNKLQTVQRQVAVSATSSEVAQFAAANNLSPEVAAKTQEYLTMWREEGRQFNIHDAARFAIGDVALNHKPDPRASQTIPVFRAPNPIPPTSRVAAEQPLPANFEDMSLDEQWLTLAKKVGNSPI